VHRLIRPDSHGHVVSADANHVKASNDDALVNSKLCPVPGTERLRVSQFTDLQRLRRLLRDGCEGHTIEPFIFRAHDTGRVVAENSGLEGFVFSQRKFEEQFGVKASEAHTTDYFIYVASVLEGEGYGHTLLKKVRELASSELARPEKHRALIDLVRTQVETWREEVRQLDCALWARHVRAYQVFPRTFNIDGFRQIHEITTPEENGSKAFFQNITGADLDTIQGLGFSALRLMGVFPIGSTNAKGTAGGSPYSILSHDIDPAHGSRSDAKRVFDLAYERRILSIFEVVPNHTACDSYLLQRNPDFFVHTKERPADPSGYFFYEHPKYGEYWIRYGGYRELGSGRREFWTDTLQLDFSRPETREYVISEICDLIRNYNLDGIRVDSAYQLLNEYLQQNWGKTAEGQESELAFDLPSREFLADLVTRVKYEFPNVVIMAEAFTSFDRLGECGVDLIYGISSMPRRGRHTHTGWHEALESRHPEQIRAAIKRAEFLSWQVGGPDIITFFGHQDFPSPRRMFGDQWVYGAAVLSILRPGASSFYAGTEACYEEPCDEPGYKVVSFNKPAKIKWEGTSDELGQFQLNLLRLSRTIQDALGERTMLEAIEPETYGERCEWVGYVVRSTDTSISWKLAVVVNTAPHPVDVCFTDPDTSKVVRFSLPPAGPEGYCLVQLDTQPANKRATASRRKESPPMPTSPEVYSMFSNTSPTQE
jgi:glycosidase